jgi:hypothetical protein
VADQDDALEAQLIDDGNDVGAEVGHRPRRATGARLTMAGEVDGHDAMALSERGQLVPPIRPVA